MGLGRILNYAVGPSDTLKIRASHHLMSAAKQTQPYSVVVGSSPRNFTRPVFAVLRLFTKCDRLGFEETTQITDEEFSSVVAFITPRDLHCQSFSF